MAAPRRQVREGGCARSSLRSLLPGNAGCGLGSGGGRVRIQSRARRTRAADRRLRCGVGRSRCLEAPPFYDIAYPAFRLGYATLALQSLGGTPDGRVSKQSRSNAAAGCATCSTLPVRLERRHVFERSSKFPRKQTARSSTNTCAGGLRRVTAETYGIKPCSRSQRRTCVGGGW